MESARAIEPAGPPEEPGRLLDTEAGKLGRFEIGGDPVGLLDLLGQLVGGLCRQAETQMNGREQLELERIVVDAECRLEG